MGDPDGVPGYWVELGLASALVAIWGMNPLVEDFSPALLLCHSAFQINKCNKARKWKEVGGDRKQGGQKCREKGMRRKETREGEGKSKG